MRWLGPPLAAVALVACTSAGTRATAPTTAASATTTQRVGPAGVALVTAPPTTVAPQPVPAAAPGPSTAPTASAAPTPLPPPTSWPCTERGLVDDPAKLHDALVDALRGSDLPPSSATRLFRQLPRIEADLSMDCTAERLTGVPSLVIAAIAYREADNDPTRSSMSGEPLGAVNPDTHVVEGTTRLDNAVATARHLRTNAAEIYGVRVDAAMTPVELAYAALAFNRGGRYCRAGQLHPMASPYVASGFVDATVGMSWPDVGGDDGAPTAWGEPATVRGHPDDRLGVMAVVRGLGSDITAPAYAWNTAEPQIACH
ncbi:MAG: hypothetical protein U0Q22_17275 [Acidimicrobiales bacterium]